MMKEVMMNENFEDVTLVTKNKKHIKAHASILSACSPLFKDILSIDNRRLIQMIYLRGILSTKVEAILQFIYLGEATILKERMDEFLVVVKSFEVKEICNVGAMNNDQDDEQTSVHDSVTSTDRKRKVVNGKYECEECQKLFPNLRNLQIHKQSLHEICDKCDRQFSSQNSLRTHMRNKHEGYACD